MTQSALTQVFKFLRRQVQDSLALALGIGLGLAFAEFAFTLVLQVFFLKIGVLDSNAVSVPRSILSFGLAGTVALFLGVGVLRGILQWGQIFISDRAREAVRVLQRKRLIRWAFYSRSVSSARVLSYFNDFADSAASAVLALLNLSVTVPTTMLLLAALWIMAPKPTLVVLLGLLVLGFALKSLDRRVSRLGGDVAVQAHQTYLRMIRNMKNLFLMQVYGTEADEEKSLRLSLDSYYQSMVTYVSLAGLKFILPQIVGLFLICAISLSARNGNLLTPGLLVSYIYLFFRFVQGFAASVKTWSELVFYSPRLRELAKWWCEEAEAVVSRVDLKGRTELQGDPFQKLVGWRVKDLSFGFDKIQKRLFDRWSCCIKPGETLVITGPSGVGKSTLVSFLLGMLHPQSGVIDLVLGSDDGGSETLDLSINRDRLFHSIGYVGPESFLIEGSIYQNLVYGLFRKPNNDELAECLRMAECQFVWNLPKGLEHRLTEQGDGLSAGQKQRLGLARALLRKPSALFLDEATSNLDRETEEKLLVTLASLKRKMTLVIVTHRESLLRLADQVVELGRGDGPSLNTSSSFLVEQAPGSP